MFKKSLTALAVLSTMTGYAVAGQVTLYGVVDEGLNYTKEDVTKTTPAAIKQFGRGIFCLQPPFDLSPSPHIVHPN